MKRKVVSVLLCAAMLGTMFAGCGSEAPKEETNTPSTDETTETDGDAAATDNGDITVKLVTKGFQHQYWQAVKKGAEDKAKELGVTVEMQGPNSESDIADQVQMLTSAVNAKPSAIGLAALDTNACLDAINQAKAAGIPIVGLDSGVAPEAGDAVVASASTDNYAAGELAAEETYKVIKDRIANASGPVRIGIMAQDATAESIINRGLGFIDKMAELVVADGKTVNVEGNDKYKTDAFKDNGVEKTEGADVVFDVAVPAQVDSALSATDCQNLLNKKDTICIYGSNQHSGDAMVTANENLKRFGSGEDQVVGVAFDSGAVIKKAVKEGTFIGAITQAPVAMGAATVELCVKAAKGEPVEDVDSGCQWYTADNMEDPEIAQNLYD